MGLFFLTNSSEGLEDTRILKTEERRFNRKVREVLEIQLQDTVLHSEHSLLVVFSGLDQDNVFLFKDNF